MANTTDSSPPRGWPRRLGLGPTMKLVMGGLVGLTALVLVLAVVLVNQLAADQRRLNQGDEAFVAATSEGALEAKGVANDERGFLISGDRHYLEEAATQIARARSALVDAQHASVDRHQQQLAHTTIAGFDRWVAALQQEFATYATDREAAIAASLGPTRDLRKSYETNLARAQTLGSASVSAGVLSVSGAANRVTRILLTCLAIVVVAGFAVSAWVIRSVAVPLYRLASFLEA